MGCAAFSRRSLPVVAALAFAMGATGVARASTVITGKTLTTNETWTPDGNPYLISGDIVVPPCLTLTIEAGTDIQLLPGTKTSAPGFVTFFIEGSIAIDGAEDAPVVFEPGPGTMPGSYAWIGLWFRTHSTGSRIQYAHLIRPEVGLSFESASATNTIVRTRITQADIGVQAGNGELILDGVVVDDAYEAVLTSGPTHLVNCAFIGHADGYGIISQQLATMRSSFINVTVENFYQGLDFNLGTITVSNSIISNAVVPFPVIPSPYATLTLSNDDVYPVADFPVACPSCFSLDPQYVGKHDLHLQSTSPCIDNGTSMWAPLRDADGTARPAGVSWDVGAYEFSAAGDAGVGSPGLDMLAADSDGGTVCVPWGPPDIAIYSPLDLAGTPWHPPSDLSVPTFPTPPDASVSIPADIGTARDMAATSPSCDQNGCSFTPASRSAAMTPLWMLLALLTFRRGRR